MLMEATTRIELVYTVLQFAARCPELSRLIWIWLISFDFGDRH